MRIAEKDQSVMRSTINEHLCSMLDEIRSKYPSRQLKHTGSVKSICLVSPTRVIDQGHLSRILLEMSASEGFSPSLAYGNEMYPDLWVCDMIGPLGFVRGVGGTVAEAVTAAFVGIVRID